MFEVGITIAELRPGHLRLGASHIRRLNCVYNRLGRHTIDRLLIDPVKAVSYQRINLPLSIHRRINAGIQ